MQKNNLKNGMGVVRESDAGSTLIVLYEDNHIIAVVKPAGVLSQPDKTGDASMYDLVVDYIRIKKGKPSLLKPGNARPVRNSEGSQRKISNGVFVGLLHRLDRPASGIMLFAKTSKGAARLSEQFRAKTVEKTYQVLVSGKPAAQKGTLKNFLGKDEKSLKAREFDDGQEANLFYELVKSNGKYSLLKIKIDAGKFHQIRAQLSMAGMPVVGDVKYGGQKWPHENIALCATGLSFQKATEDERVDLSIGAPKEWESYLSTK